MMANYDSNLIKPLQGLQRIAGLTPAKRREERKRKQQFNRENESEQEEKVNDSDQQLDLDDSADEWTENRGSLNSGNEGIDFCA